jgi:hypothetical protein
MSDETPEVQTDWRESLPEQLRDAPYFRKAESIEQVRSDLDGAAFWQGNSILKPSADASDEAKASNQAKMRELYPNLVDPDADDVYSRLGKPEEHTKYDSPEGLTIGADELTTLKRLAFNANMTKSQFKEYISGLDAERRTGAEVAQGNIAEQQETLRAEWGEATDTRKAEVGRFLRNDDTAPAYLLKGHEDGTLSPAEYKWLYSQARAGDETPEVTTHGKGEDSPMSVMEATEKASELRTRMFDMRPSDPLYEHLNKQLIDADRAAMPG